MFHVPLPSFPFIHSSLPQEGESESRSIVSDSLQPHWLHGIFFSFSFLTTWNSSLHNTGVDSLYLLWGIFLTQGSNPGLPHCRRILYQLSHKGSSRILEWVASPFFRGSLWPRNWTGVSYIAGRFFTNWAIRKAPMTKIYHLPLPQDLWSKFFFFRKT